MKQRNLWSDAFHRLLKNRGATISAVFLIALLIVGLLGDVLFDYETQVIGQDYSQRMLPPSLEHPFGTDNMGRDLLVRVLYGARYTLPVAFFSTMIAMVLGVIIGGIAGYFGGKVDNIIMRCVDIWAALPNLLLAILLVSVMGVGLIPLVISMGLTSVAIFARITRSSVISKGGAEYAEAARAIGATDAQILFQHILPNSLSPVLVQMTLRMGAAIISCSAMSFLGLGVDMPKPEWGALLSAGREFIRRAPWMCMFPGITIMLVVIAFNQLGDGLRDALDPKLKN